MDLFSLVVPIFLGLALTVKCSEVYSKNDFPDGFIFGAALSAYQWEGAAFEDGRAPSIWDTFAHAGNTTDRDNGDIACDGYHKYKEDVKLMVDMGLDAFRFSISWSRLLPSGRVPVNQKGLRFYKDLINELSSHGIEPHVTLYHYDLPQALEDEYGGWLSPKIIQDFTAYADICFREFGSTVKFWTTVNEPNVAVLGGYELGFLPPGHCSLSFEFSNCYQGNSSTEPYIAVHNMLLAHASAARLYEKQYKDKQQGSIGISVFTQGMAPFTSSRDDEIATQRARAFNMGWILHPLVFGDYPNVMKEKVGSRLPTFSDDELELVKGSFDFIGVIHYLTTYVKDDPSPVKEHHFSTDVGAENIRIGNSSSFYAPYPVVPWGLEGILEYIKQSYGNPPVYILENGQQTKHNASLHDTSRVEYLHAYIGAVLNSVRNGSNTRGYFVWSLMDVYELLTYGYDVALGLCYVEFKGPDLKRIPRFSAHWYSGFLKGMNVGSDGLIIDLQTNLSATSYVHSSQ